MNHDTIHTTLVAALRKQVQVTEHPPCGGMCHPNTVITRLVGRFDLQTLADDVARAIETDAKNFWALRDVVRTALAAALQAHGQGDIYRLRYVSEQITTAVQAVPSVAPRAALPLSKRAEGLT
jgi:hypothetical protein